MGGERRGGGRNLSLARKYFLAAALYNNSDALHNLAWMHQHGVGVARNESQALRLFERAMSAGHWQAPLSLARLLDPLLNTHRRPRSRRGRERGRGKGRGTQVRG